MNRYEFEQLLAIAHERLVMLDDLRACNVSMTYMKGVVAGVCATLVSFAVVWGIWRLL